ncbi:dehydrogenase/reductase SDR family member 7 isoform X2 [Leptinotarsa decemlineata]|uniref:dehydrogenase/reductase SDR family member 7 isoform X2 n=1 Tax=Leptinotarsa decemlineata TaxID=7539 RepID=UPI003D30BC48
MFFEWVGIIVCIWIAIFFYMTLMNDCDMQLAFYEKFGKSPDSLKGKVVLITGASSGIGEHTAYALAKSGVKLALTARRQNELLRVKRKCIEVSDGLLTESDVLVIIVDILDFWEHDDILQLTLDQFGRIDIVLNNAGRSQRALFEDIDLEVDQEMFNLNVFAVVHMTRRAMEYFNERKCGHVAVVSSIAGILGIPNSASYTASKHALHGYYNCLRTEKIGTNINVTILCPGPTFTNFLQESFTGEPKEGTEFKSRSGLDFQEKRPQITRGNRKYS